MTENKRFNLAYETNDQYCIWWAVSDGDITLWKEEVVTLLNNLSEENEQLKARIKYLERKIQRERASAMKQHANWEKEIQKENEQLKQRNNFLKKQLDRVCSENEIMGDKLKKIERTL